MVAEHHRNSTGKKEAEYYVLLLCCTNKLVYHHYVHLTEIIIAVALRDSWWSCAVLNPAIGKKYFCPWHPCQGKLHSKAHFPQVVMCYCPSWGIAVNAVLLSDASARTCQLEGHWVC